MKKGLECVLTVHSGFSLISFFPSLCRMERSCIFIKQKIWKLPSKTDIANLEQIQVWLIVCTTLKSRQF